MPANLSRGVTTLNQRYVCLSCRLHSVLAGGRTTRYQHTGPPENDGGYEIQDPIPENAGKTKQAASRSRIGDIIRSFMVKSNAKEKETNDDSRIESLGKKKVHLADWYSLEHPFGLLVTTVADGYLAIQPYPGQYIIHITPVRGQCRCLAAEASAKVRCAAA